jgi:hypothetical protein
MNTAQKITDIRKEYPKFFLVAEKFFPAKSPDQLEADLLKRIERAIERTDKIKAIIKQNLNY